MVNTGPEPCRHFVPGYSNLNFVAPMPIVAPPPGLTVGQGWLRALAQFIKLFVLVVLPLLQETEDTWI